MGIAFFYLNKWMDRIGKQFRMLAVNMSVSSECETEVGNCKGNEGQTDNKNGE
jgi:hypothetical protein